MLQPSELRETIRKVVVGSTTGNRDELIEEIARSIETASAKKLQPATHEEIQRAAEEGAAGIKPKSK